MKVLLEYKFILEPNAQHNSVAAFEQSLGGALRGLGYEPETITTNEGENCKFVYLEPIKDEMEEVVSAKTPGQKINDMSKKRSFSGKFIKNNG